MELQRLQSLLPILGQDFIAYTSNSNASAIERMASGNDPLNTSVNTATLELRALIDKYMPHSESEPGGTIDVSAHLDMLNISVLMGFQYQGNSIGNAIRILVGGSLPNFATDDNLEQELVKLAADIYPLLLLPRGEDDAFPDYMNIGSMVTPVILRNQYSGFFDALEADPALGQIYTQNGGSERLLKSMNYSLNTGIGSTQQMLSLPTELALHAHYQNAVDGQVAPNDFIRQVIENFHMFRRLVGGETVDVKAYVAINGLELPDNDTIELPWGMLRPPTSVERRLLSPRSQLLNSTLVVPFKLRLKRQRSFTAPYAFSNDQEREKVEEAAMLTAAAAMVGLGKEVRAVNVGTIIMPIIGHGPSTSWPIEQVNVGLTKLKRADKSKIVSAGTTIGAHKKHLGIALRRNLMAINRLDAVDGFIDGITALEGLFGADKETTFTVSAAMAKFLEANPEKRLQLKKEIANDLYSERSKIVHGVTFPSARAIETKRQRVIDLNILALRKLFRWRKDLIDKSSSERSAKILLS